MAVRSIVVRSVLAALAGAGCVLTTADAFAAKPVAASAYGVGIQHTERSQRSSQQAVERKAKAVEVDLTLVNRGKRDLYDIYVYLIQANGRTVHTAPEPMRVRLLKAGQSKALTWAFELQQPLMGLPMRDLTFRIEAVDPVTQEIVTFEQHSSGVR